MAKHRGITDHEAQARYVRALYEFTEARAKVHPTPTYDQVAAEHQEAS
jgi:hypothetical protein